ncbi:hypothetical protein BH24CHL1_BH24CHL1_07130 [soil metagenome]
MIDRGHGTLIAVMALVALFYMALLPVVFRHLNPVTGDEPFYIMTAQRMLLDRDLDETNNYANRDYEAFYPDDPLPANWQGWPAFPRTLPPHPATTERPGLYTKHGLGLSLLIAAPYELAGRLGAVLVVMLFAVLLAGQMFMLAREAGATGEVAALVALGLAIAMPIAPYATLIFPEIPAALLIVYAVRRLSAKNNNHWQWIATGAAVGFLPWLHQRFAVVSVVFAIAILLELWRKRSFQVASALVPIAAGGFSLLAYNQWLYGQLTQNVEDHAGFSGLTGTVNGAAGLLLDAQWGLLITAPVLIFGIAALPHGFRANRRGASLAIAAIAPYLIVVSAYKVWWGEWGPPARYLVPVVPLLAGPLGAWISRATRSQKLTAAGLWALGMALTVVGYAQPQRFYHHPDSLNKLYATLGDAAGMDLAGKLIAFQPYAADTFTTRLWWTTSMLLLLIATTYWINTHQQPPKQAREATRTD